MINFLRNNVLRGVGKRLLFKTSGIVAGALFLFAGSAQAQLSGTYTVCDSGCDYSTIQEAVDSLKSQGISSSVTMEIQAGDYNEAVNVGAISGVSATKTVTFKGMGSDPVDTRVYDGSGTAWTINGAEYIVLENLHLETENYASGSYAVNIQSSKNVTVQNCRLTASTSATYIYQHHALNMQGNTNVLISQNHIRGGGYAGISDNNSGYNTGVTIDGNLITKFYYYGIMLYYNTDMRYLNNTIDSSAYTPGQMGIYNYNTTGINIIKGNKVNNCYYMTYTYSAGTATIDSNLITSCYYGLQAYCANATATIEITRNRVRNGTYYGMMLYSYGTIKVYNNMIDVGSSGNYGLYIYPYASSASYDIAHNTIYFGGSLYTIYFNNNYSARDLKFRNNLLHNSGSGYPYFNNLLSGSIVDFNNITRANGTFQVNVNGASYTSLASYQAALANINGAGSGEQSMNVSFGGAPSNLHLDHTDPAPFGRGMGITTDYDGDTRCAVMPTVGADETENKTGDNFKTLSGTKFTGPSKTYIGYPTSFFNSAASTSRLGYRWYVDGVLVSDSMHLRTTALKYPKSVVKLEAYNCASLDSFVMSVTVDSPAAAPSADFISDLNVVRQGDVVTFTDLSTGYPAAWDWEITPSAGLLNGNPAPAYKYLYGNKTTDINKVRFDIPGKYKVCLTSSNAKGKSAQECKVDYIEVTPAVTMSTSLQTITSSSGYIFDNGGPNGNVQTAYYYNTLPKVLIDACADSVYLVFKSFDMYCGYQYLRVYEGKDKQTGKPLSCTGNMQFGAYGPGLTGSSTSTGCAQNCSPIRNGSAAGTFVYDTFKAAKYMYLEMESNSTAGYPGFEAYFWTKPRSQKAPVASFTSVDSVCTNGQVIFTNTTVGDDVTYLWDLDDDFSAFEATSKNTNWPYFAPGSYKITLIAMNCGGVDTFTKTVNVFNPASPATAFTADNVTPTTGDVVFFSKDMPMCVDDFRWTIKPSSGTGQAVYVNGTKNTSAAPQVMFTDTGCYDVTLYTANTSGEDSLKLSCFIKVRGAYCEPTTINKAADLGISRVQFHTIDNTSSQGTASYSNFALDQNKSTIIEIGVTYDLTVSRNTNKNKISRTAWIDWNADGDFNDAGEEVGEQLNSSTLSWTTPVKVPTLAKTGATVLRIAVNQGSQSNTACGPNVFGEYEDYRVYVRPDATRPVITLLGDDTVTIEQGYSFVDPGATADDNLDGNLTAKIKVSNLPTFNNMVPGTYLYKYNVTDAAGNLAIEEQRVVIVTPDKTGPDLVVPQPDTIYAEVFDANFTVPDAVLAEDLVDGDLLSEVQKSGNVNINVVGTYEVIYSVTDASGNTSTVKRVIIVEDNTAPVMALVGNATVTHEVGTPYTDDSVTLSDNYYAEADLRTVLVVQSNVDPNKLGTYTVVYTLTDPSGNGPVTVTRTVIVVDTQVPVVTLNGDDPFVMEVKNTFAEPGIVITDNYDVITEWDTSGTFYGTFADGYADQLGTYTIIYEVTDGSGNSTTVTRTVIVKDMTAPVASLKGQPAVTVCRWATYTDEGVDATDNFNTFNDLTITPEGSFVTNGTLTAGLWSLRYKVEDKSGNVTYTGWRNILVQEPGSGNCVTGITEGEGFEKYVTVFPNPSTGEFNVRISLPKSEQVKITVTNLVGQQIAVVAEGMISADMLKVDLSDQPSGVYMLNIQTAAQNAVKRVVISR